MDSKYTNLTGNFAKCFTIIESIGEGAFGQVFKASHNIDQGLYAVKKVKLRTKKEEEIKNMLKEVNTMKTFNHPCIVRYITCWLEEDYNEDDENSEDSEDETEEEKEGTIKKMTSEEQSSRSAENTGSSCEGFEFEKASDSDNKEKPVKQPGHALYIQMELCDKSLRDYLESDAKNASTIDMIDLFMNILEGVQEMHQKKILHQDLKPDNIFLGNDKKAKIGDFGLATRFKPSQNLDKGAHSKGPGTETYMPPEQLDGRRMNDEVVDVFSLGLIFYEMLGRFGTSNERHVLFRKLRYEREVSPEFESEFPRERCLIRKMANYYPNKRPSVTQAIQELRSIKGNYANLGKNNNDLIGLHQSQAIKPEWKVENAKLKEYKRSLDGAIESLVVENENGLFSIIQGLKKKFTEHLPDLGTEIRFKYLPVSNGKPENLVLII